MKAKYILMGGLVISFILSLVFIKLIFPPLSTVTQPKLKVTGNGETAKPDTGISVLSFGALSLESFECIMPGYTYCNEEISTEIHGISEAIAHAKLGCNSYINSSKIKNGYVIGEANMTYNCEGDRVTYVMKAQKITNSDCSKYRCPGIDATGGSITLAKAPAEKVPSIAVYCYDYDEVYESDNSWAVASAWRGFLFGEMDIKVIRCYDNSDCNNYEYCDRDGTWENWTCKTSFCENSSCPDYCKNGVHYYNGTCNEIVGGCGYMMKNCENGCNGDLCAGDLCKDIICDDNNICTVDECIESFCKHQKIISNECTEFEKKNDFKKYLIINMLLSGILFIILVILDAGNKI